MSSSSPSFVKKRISIIFCTRGTKLARVMHDKEIWLDNWRPGMPQVHPLFPNHFSKFGAPWQWLSKDMNPGLSADQWMKVYTGKRFLNNNDHGFDAPCANYVTGEHIRDGSPDPACEALLMGGSLALVRFEGERAYIESLDVNGEIPTAAEMKLKPFFTLHASSCDGKQNPRRFPQGEQPDGSMLDIVHPFFTNRQRFPQLYTDAWRLQIWTPSWLPDPYTIYTDLTNRRRHG